MLLKFVKMQGAGNDFIMIDNRAGLVSDTIKSELAAKLCPRAVSIGADGMIFLEDDAEYDAKWDFFNADGTSAEMCGNGARCFGLFAKSLNIFDSEFVFRTIAGPISVSVSGESRARVKLTDTPSLKKIKELDVAGIEVDVYSINTGVPHAVIAVADIEDLDIMKLGAAIRYHKEFEPTGTNVNFISKVGDEVAIRTYERGVEGETLACGTGSVAAAIVAGVEYGITPPVAVITRSGDTLNISYIVGEGGNRNIYLEGPAVIVYKGEVLL